MATAMTATPAWEVWGATAGQGRGGGVSQQPAVCPAPGVGPTTVVTHRFQSGRHGGCSREGWRPHRRRRLGSRHWSPSGSGSCSPSPGPQGLVLWAVEAQVRPRLLRSRARGVGRDEKEAVSGGGGWGGHDPWTTEPAGIWGGSGRVPYAAAQLAPGEFGLWVASGIADQGDFISFSPAAFGLGLSLLCL